MFRRALIIYAGSFVAVVVLAKAAIVGFGLPDWVFRDRLIVMALGLPLILWTGYSRASWRRMRAAGLMVLAFALLVASFMGLRANRHRPDGIALRQRAS